MKTYQYYIYIITNYSNSVFYIGVTNNLERRMFEHTKGLAEGFSKKYNLKKLVYVEEYQNIQDAIIREKQLKTWNRQWKIDLIKESNTEFEDLILSWSDQQIPDQVWNDRKEAKK